MFVVVNYFLSYSLSLTGALSTSCLKSREAEGMVALANGLELSCNRHLGSLAEQGRLLLELMRQGQGA